MPTAISHAKQLDLFDGRRTRSNPRVRRSEHSEQVALMQWAVLSVGKWPELELLHSTPNGGWRAKATAARLKAEGQKAGVPDLFLPVARGGYHGLWVEMKAARGRLSDAQVSWVERLRSEGYAVVVAFGFEAARDVIVRYLMGRALT